MLLRPVLNYFLALGFVWVQFIHMTTTAPTSAQSPSEHLGFIDEWMQSTHSPQRRDQLLDLRRACLAAAHQPLRAVKTFLRVRKLLRQRSYLHEHRLRKALQRQIEVEITTPTDCWREPLDLTWSTIQRVFDAPRRRVFEQSSVSWDRIRVRLVAKTTPNHHG